MAYFINAHLRPSQKIELQHAVGMAIARERDEDDPPIDWETMNNSRHRYLPKSTASRRGFKLRPNHEADKKIMREAFVDRHYQAGVENASEYMHRQNLYNQCRAGAHLRYRWLVKRGARANTKVHPTLPGWEVPSDLCPVQAIFVPEMTYRNKPIVKNPEVLRTEEGHVCKKAANWLINVDGATRNTRGARCNNCAPNVLTFVYQFLIQKKEYPMVARMSSNVTSELVLRMMEELKKSPFVLTIPFEMARIEMISTLKGPLETRSADSGSNNTYNWSEEEYGIEFELMRIAICCKCKTTTLKQHSHNLSLEDFKLLMMEPAEQLLNLPRYICQNKQCNQLRKHYIKLLLPPEGLVVQWKGPGKKRGKNLENLFEDFPMDIQLPSGEQFRDRFAVCGEFYKNSKGKQTGAHAFGIRRLRNSYLRWCDSKPQVDEERIRFPRELNDDTEIDLVIYTRDFRTPLEKANEAKEEIKELRSKRYFDSPRRH